MESNVESGGKGSKCPRCGGISMVIDWESGKAKCSKCGYEIFFKK